MKGYILMEIGWEYDDETYSRPEDDGGTPKKVFLSKKKAYDACSLLNAERVKKNKRTMVTEWRNSNDFDVVEEFFEVVEVEVEE